METKPEMINNIVVSQSVLKTKNVKKQPILNDDKFEVKSITDICENIELIDINFKKCVKGYHLINSSSINETIWEDINAIIFSSSGIIMSVILFVFLILFVYSVLPSIFPWLLHKSFS